MAAPASVARPGIRGALAERAYRWSRRRHGPDSGTVELTRRRIYILPTRLGLMYAALLFAMLLGGLNYGNNLALALTFLLTGAGWVAMHECHRNLLGLTVTPAGTHAPFAGQPAVFEFVIASGDPRPHLDLTLRADQSETAASVAAASSVLISLAVPTESRGRRALGRLRLSSTFPLGLCRAWTWLHPELSCLVYPRPVGRRHLPAQAVAESGPTRHGESPGDEDFQGLRGFRPGDPLRRIAWKAYARSGELLVTQYTGRSAAPVVYDWNDTQGATERRLSQLSRWIVDAEARGERYGLNMPGGAVAAGAGPVHRHECLALLALHGLDRP